MKRVILLGAVLSLLAVRDAAAQPPLDAIFSPVDAAVADRAMSSMTAAPKGVADRRVVGMHLDRLFDSGATRVLLNVDAHEWVASFERLDRDIQGHRAWVGSIEGIDYSHVSFAERDGVVSGLINAVSETYAVRTIAPGLYSLDRVQGGGIELEPLVPAAASSAAAADEVQTANDDGSVIDVLLIYTPGARVAVGGVANMNAMIAQIISDTNTIFSRSGVVTRVRLAGSNEGALPETSDMSADLSSLTNNASVNAMRDSLGADLVQLIQNSPSTTSCGIGWLLNRLTSPSTFPGFSITDYSCVSGYTPSHEMGHNMGSHHAPEDGASGALFSYSYGYKDAARAFRTVMAYACSGSSCPRVPNFSNPAVAHTSGFPTGTATQNNATSINNAASTVANFRQSTTPTPTVTVPGAPTGLNASVNGLNVTISWSAVASDAGWAASAATGYTIQVGTAPGVYNAVPTLPVGNATSVSGSGPPGTYYWRVYGSNSAGNGAPSAEASFTLGTACVAPSAPLNFTHSVGAGRVVTLSWSAPASGAGPFSYVIDAGTTPGASNVISAPVGALTSIAVTAPPGTYFVRIRAANACAASSPGSNERTIVVP